MQSVKINDIIMFFLELVMLFAFGYFGYKFGTNTIAKIGLAIALVVMAGLAWGYWAAPKSKHRLKMPPLAVFRSMMFLLAAVSLYWSGSQVSAISLAAVGLVNQVISYYGGR